MIEMILGKINEIILLVVGGNKEAVGFVTAAIVGSLIVVCKAIPLTIINRIKSFVYKEYYIDNSVSYIVSNALENWVNDNKKYLFSWRVSPSTTWNNTEDKHVSKNILAPGTHYLFKGYRLWIISITRHEPTGSRSEATYEKTLGTYSFSIKIFDRLLEELMQPHKQNNTIAVFSDITGNINYHYINKKSLQYSTNLAVSGTVKTELLDEIDYFINHKEEIKATGLPYRKTFILEGPPGTGKTNIGRYLSYKYNLRTTILSLTNINLAERLLSLNNYNTNKPDLFIIEDIDRGGAVNGKTKKYVSNNHDVVSSESSLDDLMSRLHDSDLSNFLNLFDGFIPIENVIIIMTTNHVTNLDPAFVRRGRVDNVIHVGYLKPKEIIPFIRNNYKSCFYTDQELETLLPPTTRAADLYAEYRDNLNDIDGFLRGLKKSSDVLVLGC